MKTEETVAVELTPSQLELLIEGLDVSLNQKSATVSQDRSDRLFRLRRLLHEELSE